MPTGASPERMKICGSSPVCAARHPRARRDGQQRLAANCARSRGSECRARAGGFQQFGQPQHARRLAGAAHGEVAHADHRQHPRFRQARRSLPLPAAAARHPRCAQAARPCRTTAAPADSAADWRRRAGAPRPPRGRWRRRALRRRPARAGRWRRRLPARAAGAPPRRPARPRRAISTHRAGRAEIIGDGLEILHVRADDHRPWRRAPAPECCGRRGAPACRP